MMLFTKITRTLNRLLIVSLYTVILTLFSQGCASREEIPQLLKDSTLVYPAKSDKGITAQITYCSRVFKKTGLPVNPGITFSINDKAKLFAIIDLTNRDSYKNKDLMFHIDWINPEGRSIFKKRIDLIAGDTSSTFTSAISITPDKRQPGNYCSRIYLFRELIAEKKFVLNNSAADSIISDSKKTAENLKASINFCKKLNSKTGAMTGAGKSFTIKDKAAVFASVRIENKDTAKNQPFTFYMEWAGPDDSSFYRKKININPTAPVFTFSGSISIAPAKRQPGNYLLRIYLSDQVIAENKFKLVIPEKEEKSTTPKLSKEIPNVKIILCKKVNKKNSEPVGIDSVFTIKDDGKVIALVTLEKKDTALTDSIKLIADWIGPNDTSFYRKGTVISLNDSLPVLKSSISISPDKRKPGIYFLRIFLSKKLLAEHKFELIPQSD